MWRNWGPWLRFEILYFTQSFTLTMVVVLVAAFGCDIKILSICGTITRLFLGR